MRKQFPVDLDSFEFINIDTIDVEGGELEGGYNTIVKDKSLYCLKIKETKRKSG